MTKPNRQSSKALKKLQYSRSNESFEKTRKMMTLAARISDALKEKGCSRTDFARSMNQYDSVISKWLSGTHNFTIDTLFDIENVLGICLVQSVNNRNESFTRTYECVVSVKAEKPADFYSSRFITTEDAIQHHIAQYGDSAVTELITLDI